MFCQIYPFFCPQGSSVGRGSRGRGQGVLNRALEREQDAKISPPPHLPLLYVCKGGHLSRAFSKSVSTV